MLKVNAKDNGCNRKVLIKVYINVKYEIIIFNSYPTMDLNQIVDVDRRPARRTDIAIS